MGADGTGPGRKKKKRRLHTGGEEKEAVKKGEA